MSPFAHCRLATSASPDARPAADRSPGAPRVVCFAVAGRRELAARFRAQHPGTRGRLQHSWDCRPFAAADEADTRQQFRSRLGLGRTRGDCTPLWYWDGDEADFVARAHALLLEFVHPLVAHGGPFCLGFPFTEATVEARSLSLEELARLDVEDIGVLLHEGSARHCLRSAGPASPAPGASAALLAAAHLRVADVNSLDAAQSAAVRHERGAARVLAPAGAGKTKTLVSRVVELVARGAPPASILLLAFNTKAAEQLEERLAARGVATTRRIGLDEPLPAVHCATFNAFAARYQREVMGLRTRVDTDGALTRVALRRALETCECRVAAGRDDPLGEALGALSRARAGLEPPDHIAMPGIHGRDPSQTPSFAACHAELTRLQVARGHQSFDDQIYFAVVDLLAQPVNRRRLQRKYAHVLVDEYQDLNAAQLALVDILSRPHRRLFVVGDDDQHIYGWRLADPDGILRFHERVPPRPWSQTYRLETNYRCSQAVVGAASRLIAHNQRREPKDVRPRPGAPPGAVRFFASPSWRARADGMCEFLIDEHARLGCAWRDLAVLCRYRTQQLGVALALEAAGIPRTSQLSSALFTHPASRLTRACVSLVLSPADASRDVVHAVLSARRDVPPSVVARVVAASHPWSELSNLATVAAPATRRPLAELRSLVGPLHESIGAEDGLEASAVLRHVVRGFDVLAGSASADPASDTGGALQALEGLACLAEAFPQPAAFVAAWDRLAAGERGSEPAPGPPQTDVSDDGVVISTMHAAKGREYLSVVIPDYDVDVTTWGAAQIEEERRVMYVGVTRAQHAVFLTIDSSRPYVHPFLRELVERPCTGEYERLRAEPARHGNTEGRAAAQRLHEIEALFPEMLPNPPGYVPAGPPRPA